MDTIDDATSTFRRLPYTFVRCHGVAGKPSDNHIMLFCHQPVAPAVVYEVQRFYLKPVHVARIDKSEFDDLVSEVYEEGGDAAQGLANELADDASLDSIYADVVSTVDLLDQGSDAPIIRLINAMLTEAINQGASDIHVEPFEDHVLVRLRVDGALRQFLKPPPKLASRLISRIKVLAKLDIAEKRIPQDGRISIRLGKYHVDIRVSTIPTRHGERVVMRLLDRQTVNLSFASLGFEPDDRERLTQYLQRPHGIILVTGPTGSGKTTTLYTALTLLNDGTRNILTIEDPIEYELPGIGQTQVNTKTDMTFARGLRAILRQDPDVVMIGEIRDRETAQIAIQASLTGHLVLSTLHTNTAIGTVTRLMDMGVEPFLLSSTLTALMSQRLLRKLCDECKQPQPISDILRKRLGLDPGSTDTIYIATGCPVCHETGYSGRTAVYELVAVDEEMQQLIHQQASETELERVARTQSTSLHQAPLAKLIAGVTSPEEVLRITVR